MSRAFIVLAIVLSVACHVICQEHPPLCSKGGCCDIVNGLFLAAGTPCSSSKHPCLEPSSLCTGFSAKCDKKMKADGTVCYGSGSCVRGVCVGGDGAPIEQPARSADIALAPASISPVQQVKPAAAKTEEKKADENKEQVFVHHFHDPIAESLEQIPKLAARRAHKKAVDDRKVSVFRKMTHFVLRKQKERMEEKETFVRHGKTELMQEQHDLKNLHRHLHLHHQQHHGLNETANANLVESLTSSINSLRSSLSAGDGSANDYTAYIIVGTLGFVAIMLIIFIVGSAIKKNSKSAIQKRKDERKDYFQMRRHKQVH